MPDPHHPGGLAHRHLRLAALPADHTGVQARLVRGVRANAVLLHAQVILKQIRTKKINTKFFNLQKKF